MTERDPHAHETPEAEPLPDHQGCPCVYTTPCHERCTCVNPVSSRGCSRCCTYGSLEQRLARAEQLAAVLPRERPEPKAAMKYALALMRGRLDVEAPANAAVIRGYIADLEADVQSADYWFREVLAGRKLIANLEAASAGERERLREQVEALPRWICGDRGEYVADDGDMLLREDVLDLLAVPAAATGGE